MDNIGKSLGGGKDAIKTKATEVIDDAAKTAKAQVDNLMGQAKAGGEKGVQCAKKSAGNAEKDVKAAGKNIGF